MWLVRHSFVAYCKEGYGNLIHASRCLEYEIGLLATGHIKNKKQNKQANGLVIVKFSKVWSWEEKLYKLFPVW